MGKRVNLGILQPNTKAAAKALRFYDPELQNASNVHPPDPERLRRALLKAKKLFRAYQRQLGPLRSRMSAQTYHRFAQQRDPLFDSNLLSFSFGDWTSDRLRFSRVPSFETTIEARFLSFAMDSVHILKYRRIYAVRVDVPAERWFSWGDDKPELGSLLAHELTRAGRKAMNHRFLFVSGTTIDITCLNVQWSSQKLKHSQPRRR